METVLITGANRGIGLELAKRYAAAGNRVLACCREPAKAAQLQALASAGKAVTVHGVHVANGASVEAVAKDKPSISGAWALLKSSSNNQTRLATSCSLTPLSEQKQTTCAGIWSMQQVK